MSIELYRFAYGATVEAYTTAETSVTHSGTTYLPLAIQRGNVEATQEIERSEVPVEVPRDTPVGLLFRAGEAPQQVSLTILRGDAISGGYAAFWAGFVASATFSGSVITLSCSPLMSLLRRQAPRQRYSSMCRWSLYDSGCGVSPVPHTKTVTVSTIVSPTEFSVTGTFLPTAANRYRAGNITLGGIKYLVTSSTGTGGTIASLTTSQPVAGLVSGLSGQLVRGCDHTLDGCDTFSNVARFGGFPLLPRPVRY
jgi:hypothetical protein